MTTTPPSPPSEPSSPSDSSTSSRRPITDYPYYRRLGYTLIGVIIIAVISLFRIDIPERTLYIILFAIGIPLFLLFSYLTKKRKEYLPPSEKPEDATTKRTRDTSEEDSLIRFIPMVEPPGHSYADENLKKPRYVRNFRLLMGGIGLATAFIFLGMAAANIMEWGHAFLFSALWLSVCLLLPLLATFSNNLLPPRPSPPEDSQQ